MKMCKLRNHQYEENLKCCPECRKIYAAEYRKINKDKIKASITKWNKSNPEKRRASITKWRNANPDKAKLSTKKSQARYYQNNRAKVKAKEAKWQRANPEKRKGYMAKYYKGNRDQILATNTKYRIANRKKINAQINEYCKNRLATDPLFKLKCKLRTRVRDALKDKGYTKKSKTQTLIGCPYTFLLLHLKYSAIRNYGYYNPNYGYEIDHKIPCDSAKNEEELIKLQHYSNLQYLTPEDNRAKGIKLNWKTVYSSRIPTVPQ